MHELLYIIEAKYTENELKSIIDKVSALIKEKGGELVAHKGEGKLELAYPIKRAKYGNYLRAEFRCPSESLQKLGDGLKLLPNILRYQIFTVPQRTIKPFVPKLKEYRRVERAETEKKAARKPAQKKISIEELDQKLEKILEEEIK